MEIKGTQGAGAASAVQAGEAFAKLPFDITDDMVRGVLRRSKGARDLHAEMQSRCDGLAKGGGAFSRRDVEGLVARATKKGKPDGDQAVVMAYFAQKRPEVFAPEARAVLVKFFDKVDWASLMADLNAFIEELRQKEAEAKKAEQVKQELLKDDIKRADAKRELIQDNGTKADRQRELQKAEALKAQERERLREASPADLDDELTASGRLQLSDVEKTKLGLMKKGFANKE